MAHRWCLVWLTAALMALSPAHSADRLVVFAPSSMVDVMRDLEQAYEAPERDVSVSIAGTGQLARQIASGAAADIIMTADDRWMDWLVDRNDVQAKSVIAFAGNRLVVAVRRETENWADWQSMIRSNRFAMANPDTVPAGRYGKAALESLGLWDAARENGVFGDNVRVTLQQLIRGEVEAALIYESDLAASADIRALYTFTPEQSGPIRYLAATVGQGGESAEEWLNFLMSNTAQQILAEHGFTSHQEHPQQ